MSSHENNSVPPDNAEHAALDSNKTMEMSADMLAAEHSKQEPAEIRPAEAAPISVVPVQDAVRGGTNTAAEIADDALIERPGTRVFQTKRSRVWLAVLLCVLAVPVVLTLIGALTSPPHVAGIPSGHLITLQADAPSEHTTTLRGLFVSGPDGAARLLAHETEPQDTDGGVRVWITQPVLSPDGTQLAFEKQCITLGEDKQAIDNQIWVMRLTPDTRNPPHLVIDLTPQKMKQVVGLAWDSDSSLMFLEDDKAYSVPTETDDAPLITPLALHGLTLAKTGDISATRSPALTEAGTFAYAVQTPSGPQVLTQVQEQTAPGPAAAVFAVSPAGDQIAFVPPGSAGTIRLYSIAAHASGPNIPVHWGWSVFGHREITSLRWSPDGSQLAFTVSKPPVPDEEIFVVTPATGKTVQLPYRTGRAAWDWGK